jgi:hypothetical protein
MKESLIWALEHLEPSVDLWEDGGIRSVLPFMVRTMDFKVVLYGAGVRCHFTLGWLRLKGIEPLCVVDEDIEKNGKDFFGAEIICTDRLKDRIAGAYVIALVTDSSWREKEQMEAITENLLSAGVKQVMYDALSWRNWYAKWKPYLMEKKDDILRLYDILADFESKKVLCEYIRAVSDDDFYRLPSRPTRKKYFDDDVYEWSDDEIFVDCGAYMGDTIFNLLDSNRKFGKIYAFESDAKTFSELENNIKLLPKSQRDNIFPHNILLGGGGEDGNQILKDVRVSVIKMDIEGAESDTLKNLREIISKRLPILAVCVYHKKEDLVDIPFFIRSVSSDYKLFLRKYVGSEPANSTCEAVLYAIPPGRQEPPFASFKNSKGLQ